jgi:hypothetical protein
MLAELNFTWFLRVGGRGCLKNGWQRQWNKVPCLHLGPLMALILAWAAACETDLGRLQTRKMQTRTTRVQASDTSRLPCLERWWVKRMPRTMKKLSSDSARKGATPVINNLEYSIIFEILKYDGLSKYWDPPPSPPAPHLLMPLGMGGGG